ncbi:hypothetical protein CCP3SC15_1740001 [Gammaproteobacteria bacterium]
MRTYLADLEEFGLVRFEIRPREAGKHGGGDVEYAILNEQQSTLILTFMRNSVIVVGFKKRLVKAFWEMARKLSGGSGIRQSTLRDRLAVSTKILAATKVLDKSRDEMSRKLVLGEIESLYALVGQPMPDISQPRTVTIDPKPLNNAQAQGSMPNMGVRGGFVDALHDWVHSRTSEFSIIDAVTMGLGLDASKLTRSLQVQVGIALYKLGCVKVEKRNDPIRFWYRPPHG